MTKDLALLVGPDQKWLTTIGFATLSLEAQERHERRERVYRDD
jgi:hypothetical protein